MKGHSFRKSQWVSVSSRTWQHLVCSVPSPILAVSSMMSLQTDSLLVTMFVVLQGAAHPEQQGTGPGPHSLGASHQGLILALGLSRSRGPRTGAGSSSGPGKHNLACKYVAKQVISCTLQYSEVCKGQCSRLVSVSQSLF